MVELACSVSSPRYTCTRHAIVMCICYFQTKQGETHNLCISSDRRLRPRKYFDSFSRSIATTRRKRFENLHFIFTSIHPRNWFLPAYSAFRFRNTENEIQLVFRLGMWKKICRRYFQIFGGTRWISSKIGFFKQFTSQAYGRKKVLLHGDFDRFCFSREGRM